MRNSLKSDGKLFVRMKSVWIVSFVIIVFTLFSSYNSYNGAYTFIQDNWQYIQSTENAAFFNDGMQMLHEYFTALHPQNMMNNAMGLIIGVGALALPIISALFFGIEYSQKTVRLRAATFGLEKSFFSKLIILAVYLLCFLFAYTLIMLLAGQFMWNSMLSSSAEEIAGAGFYVQAPNNAAIFFFTYFILLFFMLISMMVTVLFKSGIGGIVAGIVFNYITIPSALDPHSNINYILSKILYMSPASPVLFRVNENIAFYPVWACILILACYFLLCAIVYFLVGIRQKN